MKTTLSIIEKADNALILMMNNISPILYIKELEKLCRSCGWGLEEYWKATLANIDASWEDRKNVLS